MDLLNFQSDNFLQAIKNLFEDLNVPMNYISDEPTTVQEILKDTYKDNSTFQLVDDLYFVGMVDDAAFKGTESINTRKIQSDYDGILIFGITLKERDNGLLPTRTQLAEITRAFNREFYYTPVVAVFKYADYISLANVERLKYKQEWREGEKAGKVSLLRDILIENPHTGHLKILKELKVPSTIQSFKALYSHWQSVFSVNLLNKKFYREISNWYFWAVSKVKFPNDVDNDFDDTAYNSESMIRLLTRLIFIWFLKEKQLVPEILFKETMVREVIKGFCETDSHVYYRAILQNLFFGTLNQKIEERRFAEEKGFPENRKEYGVKNIYRYADEFSISPEKIVELFSTVPFLNGGLFDCLDYTSADGKVLYMDGFSRNPRKRAMVPDELFFTPEFDIDLSNQYGDPGKKNEKVRGLIPILSSYKFTISENTPLEEDVALDPELLGKVFENLLASYNPETRTNARNQTGSFYTPREIVDYMVDESLIAYLESEFENEEMNDKLHTLFSYDEVQPFKDNEHETLSLIRRLDQCTIFDPACGSGAFPMGILHKIVHVLGKLDPENSYWYKLQIEKVQAQVGTAYTIKDKEERKIRLEEIDRAFDRSVNDPDYARKLYLIENSIYGSDIQPIAAQISKLRFFISLIVDQKPTGIAKENYGIRPLPNLETKFVTADSLIGLDNNIRELLLTDDLLLFEDELKEVRHNYFNTRTRVQKLKFQEKDREIREEMIKKIEGMVANKNAGIRQQIEEARKKLQYLQKGELTKAKNKIKKLESMLLDEASGSETARLLASWDPYDQNGKSPFFDPEWMFGLKDGFDIVMGNPPYIQLQKDSGKLADLYADKDFSTFVRSGDIYCLFYERGIDLINEKGSLCYITSNKWMKAKYGEKMRAFFLKHGQVETLIDFGDAHLFENATTYTNILLYKKKKSSTPNTIVDLSGRVDLESTVYDLLDKVEAGVADFSSSRFLINNQSDTLLKGRIEALGTPLKNWDVSINYGIKTGFNEAFIIDTETRDRLISEDPNSKNIIKPLLRGRDVKRYRVDWQDLWLIDTHNGYGKREEKIAPVDIQQYPGIRNHLEQYTFELEKRGDKGITPYNLRSCAYEEEFSKEKIIYPNMTNNLPFMFDSSGYYTNQKCFIITGKYLKYLTGMLNSKFMFFWLSNECPHLQGKTYEPSKIYMELLPIPQISEEDQEPFNELLDYIQFAHKHHVMDPTGSRQVATYFEEVMDLLAAGVLFKEEMQKAECFINNDLLALLPSLDAFAEGEDKIEHVSQTYKSLSTEPIIESSRMRYKLIDVLRPMFKR